VDEQVQQADRADGQHQHQPAEREYKPSGPGDLEFRKQGNRDGGDDGAWDKQLIPPADERTQRFSKLMGGEGYYPLFQTSDFVSVL
jgi:hypothetical protein